MTKSYSQGTYIHKKCIVCIVFLAKNRNVISANDFRLRTTSRQTEPIFGPKNKSKDLPLSYRSSIGKIRRGAGLGAGVG